ncbi:MAG: CBS domain-containing protein [Candidatus Acidiferrales bacterium]|jgi:CBS-domain-containing membrane protein
MKVQDVMMGTPAYCSPETNLGAATELLWNRSCGILPVIDAQQKIVGVVTDRDICVALGTGNRLPGEITVAEVSSGQVYSCQAEDDIHAALEAMAKNKVRRLPVINRDGMLEGILSMDNVVLHAESAGSGRGAELSHAEIVNTLQRIYGPQLPEVIKTRVTAA